MESEDISLTSLESFEEGLSRIEESFHDKELSEAYESLEEFRDEVLTKLCETFAAAKVIKIRKFLPLNNYILWFVVQVHEKFVYAVIFNLLWFDDHKEIKMYKKLEEMELEWISRYSPKVLRDYLSILSSEERFDYSLVSNPEYEEHLPQFEDIIGKISGERYLSHSRSHHHHCHHRPHHNHRSHHNHRPHHNHHPHHNHRHREHRRRNISLRDKYRTYSKRDIRRRQRRQHSGNRESERRDRKVRHNRKYCDRERGRKYDDREHDRERDDRDREHDNRDRERDREYDDRKSRREARRDRKRDTRHRRSKRHHKHPNVEELVYTSSEDDLEQKVRDYKPQDDEQIWNKRLITKKSRHEDVL